MQTYIYHLKYSGWNSFLSTLIHNAVIRNTLSQETGNSVVVPIPLHQVLLRNRGPNKEKIIAN